MLKRIRHAFCMAAAFVWTAGAQAQDATMSANIRGGGGDGKCTIEVEVDGVAEVTVNGAEGRIRTLEGAPARWRRFVCNQVFPRNPDNFRFRGIDGRGDQTLVREPGSGGRAVVRIEDRKGGSEGYTFDLEWNGSSSGSGGGRSNRNSGAGAVDRCREAVRSEARSRGYNAIDVRSIDIDNNPGRRDWVVGNAVARRDGRRENFNFECSVNLQSGQVRNVSIRGLN